MKNQHRKSLNELFSESYQFERRLAEETDESAREQLMARIEHWLRGCVEHGRFLSLESPERRALGSLLDRWRYSLHKLEYYIQGIDDLADFDPDAGVVLMGTCPYPGLKPFTEDQRTSFFGRGALAAKSVTHLQRQGNRILMIVGNSGTGKSSVALAGILPSLKELHDREWLFGPPLTPGQFPLNALATSVAQAIQSPEKESEIAHMLANHPGEAHDLLANLCQDKPLMLLIDQFEELLTLCSDKKEQGDFGRVLFELSDPAKQETGFACRILMTLRTDHLARLENSKTLEGVHKRLVQPENIEYLSAIDFNDIKRAIKEPADKIGLRFIPPDLVNQLANQATGHTAGLPLLQFALQRLWETRPKNESGEPLDLITEKMVDALPSVVGALGKAAEEVFATFTDFQKKISERLFLELLVLDENFQDPLRRRRDEKALYEVLLNVFNAPGDIDTVINAFVKPGLLVRFGDASTGHQIEVAHEALLRNWKHIDQIVAGAEAKERLHLIKQIGMQSNEWEAHNRDKSGEFLQLRGEKLNRAVSCVEGGWLAEEVSIAYVAACRNQERKEFKNDRLARKTKNFQWLFICVACVALSLAIWMYITNCKSELKAHLENGYSELKKENYTEAEIKFNAANKVAEQIHWCADESSLASIASGLGEVYLLTPDKRNQAILSFERAIKMEEKNKHKDIGNIIGYKLKLSMALFRTGDRENIGKARVKYQEIVTDPNTKDKRLIGIARSGVGNCLLFEKEYKLAVEQYEKALQDYIDPNLEFVLKQLASTHIAQASVYMAEENTDSHEQALESFGAAIEIYEELVSEKKAINLSLKKNTQAHYDILFNLAQAYFQSNQLDKAEATCGRILAEYQGPPNIEAPIRKTGHISMQGTRYLLGIVQLKRGMHDEAIKNLTLSLGGTIEKDPTDAWTRLYLAEAYLEKGDNAKADENVNLAEHLSSMINEEIQRDKFIKEINRVKNKWK